MATAQDDISQVVGDPIQQLFTTLGKFHRHLNKIQHSPTTEGWCDDCMNELMAGLEISIACDWTPVKDALIDAARILHSYEQSGKASLCIPFLHDSYELLSLMVGDLIVDRVRDGVKQKWREHYMRAVDELEAHGVELVEDDDREVVVNHAPVAAVHPSTTDDPPPEPAVAPLDTSDQHETLDSSAAPQPTYNEDLADALSPELAAELDSMEFELPALSSDFDIEDADHSVENAGEILPFPTTSKEEVTQFDLEPDADSLNLLDQGGIDANETLEQVETAAPDSIAKIEEASASDDNLFDAFESDETPQTQVAAQETAMDEASQEAVREDTEVGDMFANEAYECDAPPPEEETPADRVVETAETEMEPAPDAVEPVKSEEMPDTHDSDSPAALLLRAHQAITTGDMRHTKAIALELAVAMARLEYEQTRQKIAASEQQLVENGRIIEQGEANVAQKENELLRAEELLAARDGERNSCRERIGAIDDELTSMMSGLADIDAQIAALQQRRTEQLNRIENKQAEHEEAVDAESRTQTEMEALAQETESIRDRLDEARKETRGLYAQRRAIELDIIQAQEEIETQRLSLAAIERTLYPNSGAPPPKEDSDSLL